MAKITPERMQTLAWQSAMKMVLATLISRLAKDTDDPEEYVISLLTPLRLTADSVLMENSDDEIMVQTYSDMHDSLEGTLLEMLSE